MLLFSEVKYSDRLCILCIWCLSETCVTIYVVFSNLMLIWVSYCVNNHHMVAVVIQEESLKMVPNLSLKCVMIQYVWWRGYSEFECNAP